MTNHQCTSCRSGEIDYAEDDVRMVIVRDPDKSGFVLRGYLCAEHIKMYEMDGYTITSA